MQVPTGKNNKITNCKVNGIFKINNNCTLERSSFLGKISINDNSEIHNSSLYGYIEIDTHCKIANSIIEANIALKKNSVVENAHIKGNIKLQEGLKLIGGTINLYGGNIEIGRYSSLNGPNLDIHAKINKVRIGNFCSIARNVSFQEYNHRIDRISTYFINNNLIKESSAQNIEINSKGDIIVENDVWIGTHCVILTGAHISTGAIIAANSVVTGYIPPYAIASGSPAKVIKLRFDPITITNLLQSKWWDWSNEKIIENSHLFLSRCNNEVSSLLLSYQNQ